MEKPVNEKHTQQDVKYGEEKVKKMKNEKYTLQDLDYGKETLKSGKGDTNMVCLDYIKKHSKT